FASSNTAVASVDASTGEVTIVGAGSTTISVTQLADGTYCAVSDSYELTVTSANALLIISGDAYMGETCLQSSIEQTYTITNIGGQTATINNIIVLHSDFSVNHNFYDIAPGASGEVTVTYNPQMFGSNPTTNLQVLYSGGEIALFDISATITAMLQIGRAHV